MKNAFIRNHLNKPLVLIGMMGTGKSRMGRALASALDLPFFDTDRLVEEKAGRSVAEIFEVFGEKKFRSAEKNTVLELLSGGQPCVIATGGGAVTSPESLEAIKAGALSVWMRSDIEDILARMRYVENRPLLKEGDPESAMRDLLVRREHLYAQADIIFDVRHAVPEQTLDRMIGALYSFLSKA